MEKLLQNPLVFQLLEMADREMAETVRVERCRICGGRLHRSDYERKPWGGPDEVVSRWNRRMSYCCEASGCRRRHTPPSLRFMGRKIYIGVVVVLVSAMMNGVNKRRASELNAHLGIDVRTLKRWRQWWLVNFVQSPFWRTHRSRFMPVLDEKQMPCCLVEFFEAHNTDWVTRLMEFLSAISTAPGKEGLVM